MPDVNYGIKGVRKNCISFSQKISLLWPICGRRSLADETVISDINHVIRYWRTRVSDLHELGWTSVQATGKVQFVRNCPPVIGICANQHTCQCCKLNGICPWCHARQTEKVFNLFAKYLPKRGCLKNSAIKILELSNSRVLRRKGTSVFLESLIIHARLLACRLIKRLKPLGAYFDILIEPRVIEEGKVSWRLSYRIIAMVDEKWEMPCWLVESKRKKRITLVTSRKELINPIARTRRYPIGLFRCDSELVLLALNARHKTRCSATLGCFRMQK